MKTLPMSRCIPSIKYRWPKIDTSVLVTFEIRLTKVLNSSEQVIVIRSVFLPVVIRGWKSSLSCIRIFPLIEVPPPDMAQSITQAPFLRLNDARGRDYLLGEPVSVRTGDYVSCTPRAFRIRPLFRRDIKAPLP